MTDITGPIEDGVSFKDLSDESPVELVRIDGVWIDTDGCVQVSIAEYSSTITAAHNSLEFDDSNEYGHRTVTKDDLLTRIREGELARR